MNEQIVKSAEIALLGMGTVFVLLTVLVFAITIVARLCSRYEVAEPSASGAALTAASGQQAGSTMASKVAAATIAVKQYRQGK